VLSASKHNKVPREGVVSQAAIMNSTLVFGRPVSSCT
jgi:hypothetical protein